MKKMPVNWYWIRKIYGNMDNISTSAETGAKQGESGGINTIPENTNKSSNDFDVRVYDSDIENYRNELGNPIKLKTGNPLDTMAVGKTNISGLEGKIFKGASSAVRKEVGLADLDEVYPNRSIVAPFDYNEDYHLEQYAKLAEENVIAEFENALEKAGIAPMEARGELYIRQSFTNGVCNKCTLGLFKSAKEGRKGIFKQFIEKYPYVNLYVSTYKGGGTGKGQ